MWLKKSLQRKLLSIKLVLKCGGRNGRIMYIDLRLFFSGGNI
jgi:hypothetical protein